MNVLIAGATGLVGSQLMQIALNDNSIETVVSIGRRKTSTEHKKLNQQIVNFDNLETLDLNGIDTVFCCLGTTIKKAGSQEIFRKVDYTYVLNLAKWAEKNAVDNFLVISAMGAEKGSSVFYSKVKYEMESSLEQLNIPTINIIKPSLLLGDRKEIRLGESIGAFVMKLFNFAFVGPLKKYKAIPAKTVARALLRLSKRKQEGVYRHTNDALFKLAED